MLTKENYSLYIKILEEELVPAMGCTEPISIAYAAAKARQVLGCMPISARIGVSGNIVKNVKSVTVPHTGGMRGIKSAFMAGIIAGNADSALEVLSNVSEEQVKRINKEIDKFNLDIYVPDDSLVFDIRVELKSESHKSFVRIINNHTNIVQIKLDDKTIYEHEIINKKRTDRSILNVKDIVEFADVVNIKDVEEILLRQVNYNMDIALEGLINEYGANIGKTILKSYPENVKTKAQAYAAAASDARMNGCEKPVIINSGSGNQGITASIPVVVFSKELGASNEELFRALCVSNLITIHLKSGIGTLSAYCGVVSAGAGAACGIAYLKGGRLDVISHVLVNSLAIDSGIICDGAKASCAAKIATAVETGILGYDMYINGNQFYAGDGIVKHGVEKTIQSVSRLARKGMCETDKEIIKIMIE
ncbi:MAG: serine dehydratase subunit alpha family protein [Anaeroplasma sp.]